jgi:DNA-binding transcriptional ArsR family regulator
VAQVLGQERDHLAADLQIGDLGVEVDAVQAVQVQRNVTVEEAPIGSPDHPGRTPGQDRATHPTLVLPCAVVRNDGRAAAHPAWDERRRATRITDPGRTFTQPLGLSQPTVSHHLKKLVTAGLLNREQRGVWAYYSLNRDALGRLAAVANLQGGTA